MDIKLMPVSGGRAFTFPSLPEQISGKKAAKYQSYDIISQGSVKIPKGTEVEEISWNGEFFGSSKRNEAIVKSNYWMEPVECVNIIDDYIKNETILNLIVTDTWINMDVTISSFQATAYGAYGNIRYSIAFAQKKPLVIYDTSELTIDSFSLTLPREDFAEESKTYTVVSGDTLSGIASSKCGGVNKWRELYDANADTIESAAKAHGRSNSDYGHWIWPGEVLTLI